MENKMNGILTIFENPEFGKVRTEIIDGEVWFVGKDICTCFNDKNHNRTLAKVDTIDKMTIPIKDRMNRTQHITVVNESGLYSILFTMQPQRARKNGVSNEYPIGIEERIQKLRRFKRWVTSEVLPSIRKTGSYSTPMTVEQQVQIIAQGQTEIRGIVEKQEEEIENLQTKVEDLQEQINVIGAYKNSYKYEELKTAISSHVLTLLPGQLGRVLWAPYFYRAIHAALKNHFKVASSKLIQNNQLDSAKDIVYQWKPTKKYIDEKLKELQSKREAGVLSDKRVAALYYWLSTTDNGKNYTF